MHTRPTKASPRHRKPPQCMLPPQQVEALGNSPPQLRCLLQLTHGDGWSAEARMRCCTAPNPPPPHLHSWQGAHTPPELQSSYMTVRVGVVGAGCWVVTETRTGQIGGGEGQPNAQSGRLKCIPWYPSLDIPTKVIFDPQYLHLWRCVSFVPSLLLLLPPPSPLTALFSCMCC